MVACAYCKKESRMNKGLSFHTFPSKQDEKDKWVKNMGRENWTPSKYSALCANHFSKISIDFRDTRARLRKGSIPTIFGIGGDCDSSVPIDGEFSEEIIIEENNDTNILTTPPIVPIEDCQETDPDVNELYNCSAVSLNEKMSKLHHEHLYDLSGKGIREKLQALEERNRRLAKELKNKRRKEARNKRKIDSMRKVIERLSNGGKISYDMMKINSHLQMRSNKDEASEILNFDGNKQISIKTEAVEDYLVDVIDIIPINDEMKLQIKQEVDENLEEAPSYSKALNVEVISNELSTKIECDSETITRKQ